MHITLIKFYVNKNTVVYTYLLAINSYSMLHINNNKLQYCYEKFKEVDKQWIKRKRLIDTSSIFNLLAASAITNTGISTTSKLFNNHSHVKNNIK